MVPHIQGLKPAAEDRSNAGSRVFGRLPSGDVGRKSQYRLASIKTNGTPGVTGRRSERSGGCGRDKDRTP